MSCSHSQSHLIQAGLHGTTEQFKVLVWFFLEVELYGEHGGSWEMSCWKTDFSRHWKSGPAENIHIKVWKSYWKNLINYKSMLPKTSDKETLTVSILLQHEHLYSLYFVCFADNTEQDLNTSSINDNIYLLWGGGTSQTEWRSPNLLNIIFSCYTTETLQILLCI